MIEVERLFAPSSLAGEGWDGGEKRDLALHRHSPPPSPSPVEGEGTSGIELFRAWGLGHFRVQVARYLMAGGNFL